MMKMNKLMATMALTVALAAPTLALAQQGHRARAQAPDMSSSMSVDSTHMSPDRVRALKDCTALEQKWDQRTWGRQQLDVYRSCMAAHGQME